MGDVIKPDFGKEAREFARGLARLLKLVDEREQDILDNPSKYIDLASRRLAEQEVFIHKLWEALRLPWLVSMPSPWINQPPRMIEPDLVRIDRRDYEAFQAVKALINSRVAAVDGQSTS